MPFQEKHLWVLPTIESGGRLIKRYHVSGDPAGIPADVEKAAYAILPDLLPPPDGTPPATFVVLHKGGDTGAYMNAYSWAWDNALHFDGAAAGQPVLGCPDQDPTHFVRLRPRPDNPLNLFGCVWELPPLLHERNAWVRHMLVPDIPDLDAYLTDSLSAHDTGLTGPVVAQ